MILELLTALIAPIPIFHPRSTHLKWSIIFDTRQVYKNEAMIYGFIHRYLLACHIRGKRSVSGLVIHLSGNIVNGI